MKTQEINKLPPHDINLEEVVLGGLLIDTQAIAEVDFLKPYMFYKDANKFIYQSILDEYNSSGKIDLITVSDNLRKSGKIDRVGGEMYLIELMQKVSSSAHIGQHGTILRQYYIKRKIINICSTLIEHGYDHTENVFDTLDNAYSALNRIGESVVSNRTTDLGPVIDEVLMRGSQIYDGKVKPGIETPIQNLTRKTGGWRNSELIIQAARPGMGKTAFAILEGLYAAKSGVPTAFFSLEMSAEQLTSRILSMEHGIDNDKFNVHGLSESDRKEIMSGYIRLKELPFYIDDTASMTIQQLQIRAKKLHSKLNLGLIIVDYLQLMSGGNTGNREQEISSISRGLKLLAKELNIPVIALSQLSRAVEIRGGSKRPLLSDLRESGAIEQDADMVMFLYRPEYYQMSEWDEKYANRPCAGECEYIVAKNRNGGLTSNRMKFVANHTLFKDIEDELPGEAPF